jgi:hypothetical protein
MLNNLVTNHDRPSSTIITNHAQKTATTIVEHHQNTWSTIIDKHGNCTCSSESVLQVGIAPLFSVQALSAVVEVDITIITHGDSEHQLQTPWAEIIITNHCQNHQKSCSKIIILRMSHSSNCKKVLPHNLGPCNSARFERV